MMNKVFLGGTCNGSKWRDQLIPSLKIEYFNPVVDNWTAECQEEEERQKNKLCNIHLYVITPLMNGYCSIAEIMDSTTKKGVTTVVCVLDMDIKEGEEFMCHKFSETNKKSLDAVCKMAKANGAFICDSLSDVARTLNALPNCDNYDKDKLDVNNLSEVIDKTIILYEQRKKILANKGYELAMSSPKEYILKNWDEMQTLDEILHKIAPMVTCQDNTVCKDQRWIDGASIMVEVLEKVFGIDSKKKVAQYIYNHRDEYEQN